MGPRDVLNEREACYEFFVLVQYTIAECGQTFTMFNLNWAICIDALTVVFAAVLGLKTNCYLNSYCL